MKVNLLPVLFSLPLFAAPRWISTSPQLTEWIFQLGMEKALVATTDQSFFPEAAKQLPTIGPLFQPAVERTVAHRPDLVLLDKSSWNSDYVRTLTRLGIECQKIEMETVSALLNESERFTLRWGAIPDARLKKLSQRWKEYSQAKPLSGKKFLAFTWLEPPILFGQETFLSDLLMGLGAENLASSLPRENRYPKISEEWLLRAAPDFIVYLEENPEVGKTTEAGARRWWPNRKPQVVGLSPREFSRISLTPLENLDSVIATVLSGSPQ